ncbi:G-protein coupled receptor 39 [Fukomys damarensis]|uniref:G-protein coupled receptor 39 n=1 Tax=Fukomys damarensis TaxID=885580 RepID=UPI0005403163|nr:G-protein coupled receptor 39 [Fukomys damarensis]
MASHSESGNDCSQIIDHDHVPEFEVATWIKITLFLVYLIIFVVGILGNSITIRVTQVLQKKGYLQKEVTDHMVSLACSDILVFLIGMPMEFYSIIWNPLTTPSDALSCKLHTFLFETCSYATLLHVLTLSFERYIAICHPFRYKAMSGPCQVKLLIAFVWVTSALVALPLLFAMGIEYPLVHVPTHPVFPCNRSRNRHQEHPEASNMSICTNLSSRWTVFQSSIFGAFVLYLLVLLAVTFMCWNMMQVIMRSKLGTVAGTGQVQLRKAESEESRTARRQIIIFLRLIVVTLAVCWMPNQIRRIMAAAKPKHDWTKSYFRAYMILLPFSDTFFFLSSVVNPLLYNVSSLQFRRVFGQVLRCHLTLPHANQERRLRAQGSCSTDMSRSARSPLIFLASHRNSSARRTNKVFLSTFQSQATPEMKPRSLSQESPQPNSGTSAAENGFQELEV